MTDDETAAYWSEVAGVWSGLWGAVSEPARAAIIAAARIGPGTRVLDVGCGGGEFVAQLTALGADASGIDPAAEMVRLARERNPGADIREGVAESLPWGGGAFDAVTAVNALQFAEDTFDALGEFARVAVPGGCIAIANWAERAQNQLDELELAVAGGEEHMIPDGELRLPGGLEALLTEAGFEVIDAGLVDAPWSLPDRVALVRGVLMGADDATIDELAPELLTAAEPFRTADGGYLLRNAFRYAVARTPQH